MAAFLGVVTGAGMLAACASTPEGPVAPEVRRAEVIKVEITEQTFTDFTGVIHVKVDPGADAGLVADAADWNVSLKGEPVAKGRAELGQAIPAGGTVLQLPFHSAYAPTDEALGALLEKPTSLPGFYQGVVLASVGPKKIEFAWSHSAFVRSPRVPKLKMFHVEAAKFHEQKEIALVFFIDVENPNPFEVKLQGIDYDLLVDGRAIVQKGLAGVNAKVPPGSAARIEIPVSLVQDNFKDIDRLIKQPTSVPYKLDGDARLGLGHIPFELEGPIDLGAGTVKHAAD